MIVFLLLSILIGTSNAEDQPMPEWVIPGIMSVESRSYYLDDGTIKYVDRRHGAAGELGCCQITYVAFKRVQNPGESFARLASSPAFCVIIARRYLAWIYEHEAGHDWLRAVGMYNAGFGTSRQSITRRTSYLVKVRQQGGAP